MIRNIHLAWRFLLRDYRSGELWLLVASLLIAVSVSSAIAIFSERLQLSLNRQVAEVMGADLVVASPTPLNEELRDVIAAQPVEIATTLEFPSVVVAGEERMQLVSAKAVSGDYPVRGHLRTSTTPYGEDAITNGQPSPGEVWLEPRLFSLLDISPGDSIQLGSATLTVTRAITLETDRSTSFRSLSPRLMFNLDDIAQTNIIQPGSRVDWQMLAAGSPQQIAALRDRIVPLLSASERLTLASDSDKTLGSSVRLLKQFLGLGSLAAVLLAGVAVAMSTRRFVERRFDAIAIMRCMGAVQSRLISIFTGELLFIALLTTLPGVALGWLMQWAAVQSLAGVLPAWLPEAGVQPYVIGGSTGLLTFLGFGLAPLLRLGNVAPLRVLRRESVPANTSSLLAYSFAFIVLFALLWYHTGQWLTTAGLLAGILATLVTTSWLVRIVLDRIQHSLLSPSFEKRERLSLSWRLGLKRLLKEQGHTTAQLIAFTLTFMAMGVVLLIRTELLQRWQEQLPENAPNYFALNLQSSQVESFQTFLADHSIEHSGLYPIVRGRLTEINGKPAKSAVPVGEHEHNALNRELNMTWQESPPPEQELVEGTWWQPGESGRVSVEKSIAGHLGLSLGDRLTFVIGGRNVSAEVSSIREVEWESFQPNFYIIFPEQTLQGYPVSWFNSFYLPATERPVLNRLVREFPTVSLLDVDTAISQLQGMLKQSMSAVEAMLVALLLAGLLVLAASIEASLDTRRYEGALIRSLGGTRRQLMAIQVGEFFILGTLAGLFAAVATEVSYGWLNVQVFELNWQPAVWVWLTLPLVAGLLIGIAGWLGVRRVLNQTPDSILKASN